VRLLPPASCVLAAAAATAARPVRLLTGSGTGVPASAWQQLGRLDGSAGAWALMGRRRGLLRRCVLAAAAATPVLSVITLAGGSTGVAASTWRGKDVGVTPDVMPSSGWLTALSRTSWCVGSAWLSCSWRGSLSHDVQGLPVATLPKSESQHCESSFT
jgi:hypothetical protein